MATYTAVASGGNWNSTATWGGSGYPVAGDTAQITSAMTGTVTVNVASACTNLDMTGNGGTLAFGTYALTVSGSTKLYGTMTATSGNNLTITGGGVQLLGNCGSATTTLLFTTAGQTLTSGGYTWGGKLTLNYAGTFVLSGNWVNTGLVTISSATVLNWTTNETITCNGGLTTATSSTLTGTATIIIGGTGGVITMGSGSSIANNLTWNCTSATIASGNTLTYKTGTMTYTAGTITTTNSTLYFTGACTLTGISNISWNTIATALSALTVTMNSDLICTGILKIFYPNTAFTGGGVTCGTLYANYYEGNTGITLDASKTLTINTAFQVSGDFGGTYTMTIKSATSSSSMNLIYNGTAANCKVSNCIFTDVDASGGNMINNYFGGTLTRTKNIRNVTNTDLKSEGSWCGTLAQETGANARGGSGSCVKLTPKSTAPYDPMYWTFLVPTTASTAFVLNFYDMISSGFNGTMTCTVYDTDDTTKLLNAGSVTLTNDATYHLFQTGSLTPTATGFCRVVLTILSSTVAGSIYVDDVSLS